MKKSKINAAIIAALLISSPTQIHAQDEEKSKWSGSGQLGLTSTSGNSDTESFTAGLNIRYETGKWVNDWGLDVLQASADGEDTADRFIVYSKTGYKFSEKDYLFYGTRYENDNFTGFDYVNTNSVGWGHKFFDTEEKRFVTEIGLGYKVQAVDIDRSEIKGAALTGRIDYMRQITDTMRFENLTVIEAIDDNTFLQNDAGFSFKINDKFSVKLAHQLRHNTDVPVGTRKTDTLVSANLVYAF